MSELLISESEIAKLISPLCETDNATEVFASAALSLLTEPGDRIAGRFVNRLGSVQTLSLLIKRLSATRVQETYPMLAQELSNDFNTSFVKLWDDACQRWMPRLNLNSLRACLTGFSETKGILIDRQGSDFPSQLHDLDDATPLVLWVRGNAGALHFEHSMAIVGSRIATGYGQQVSVDLAEVCAKRQVTTVSGGAFGIDSLVHRASLELESPTIAVLAGGLDQLYPRGNAPLFEQLLRENVIIAEVAPGVAPAKWRFLMRNRLIAALGQATVVVEAGKRSGSMSTAGHALTLERPIGVVPGRIYDSSSRGCLNLHRDNPGAVQLLTCAEDTLELIGLESKPFELRESLGKLELRALDAFGRRTLTILDVQRIAGLTFSEAQLALGRLELDGYLERHINGYRKKNHNLET